ncbi:MAG: hypothetical protein EPN91_02435 [Salinibacterium sp.]|nr:MAG: hypothetical protein EPN91_02435 [Salinibacterium sp.]
MKLFPSFACTLKFQDKDLEYLEPLYIFFEKMHGRFGTFTFPDVRGLGSDTMPDIAASPLLVGVSDGTTVAYDIPSSETQELTVRAGIDTFTDGSGITLTLAGGSDGLRDLITFDSAPGIYEIITLVTPTRGRWTTTCRFDLEAMPIERFAARLTSVQGVRIVERRNIPVEAMP